MIITKLCSVLFVNIYLSFPGLRFEFGIMKFRKGDSVEVLRRVHDPCGSWFPGTIVSVDGNDYVIRYKFLLDDEGELILEKVPGVDIRPLPLCEAANRWRVGDIAEVFDNQCWRVGKIAKVLQNNGYVVRLSGSIQLKEFHVANIRVRKSWHNSQWSVTGKVAQDKQFTTKNDSKYSLDLLSIAPSLKIGKDLPLGEDGRNDSKMYFRMGTMKRCHADYFERNSRNLVIAGSHKKRNSSTWAGGCNRPQTGTPPLFRQVVDISFPRVQLDEKFIGGSTDMETKMAKATTDSLSGKKHEFPSSRHKLEVDIHELELHAYESTVQALYASGPLSWEQESLLTNLRLSLNISDEEHLLQLRHLLSAQVA
ncbi:uncharacterized protein LOC102613084 isoform X3 [Citrus sinensis]|uniref:uncharacterized protein LOC102613084 isoform X3 n=1 Tax=Citrus sinensis TaxID=2711 RepID=UPI00227811F8|nr:uncharacterized protein LOC102613084 isoform X3 [Citrus sinensis]